MDRGGSVLACGTTGHGGGLRNYRATCRATGGYLQRTYAMYHNGVFKFTNR